MSTEGVKPQGQIGPTIIPSNKRLEKVAQAWKKGLVPQDTNTIKERLEEPVVENLEQIEIPGVPTIASEGAQLQVEGMAVGKAAKATKEKIEGELGEKGQKLLGGHKITKGAVRGEKGFKLP